MVRIVGGSFWMGTDSHEGSPADGEGPAHKVRLRPFFIDRTAVTNEEFAAFVENTDYRTEAEDLGWSFVFYLLLPDDFPPTRAVAQAPWWRQVEGATWRLPEGPSSSIETRRDHPVVHVSWNDAVAYARWAGNVWEWCADWFSPTYYRDSPRTDPTGPREGLERVIRGGSYLCHASYCNRYRVAARSHNTPDSSTGHLGFRCARDEE